MPEQLASQGDETGQSTIDNSPPTIVATAASEQNLLPDARQEFLRSYPSTAENVFVQALTTAIGYAGLVVEMLAPLLEKTDCDRRERIIRAMVYALHSQEEGMIGVTEVQRTATIAKQALEDPTGYIPIRRLGEEMLLDTR